MCKKSASVDDMIDYLSQRQKKISQSLSLQRIAARSTGGMTAHITTTSIETQLDQSMSAGKMLLSDDMK